MSARILLSLLLLVALVPCAEAGSSKKGKAQISFHLQADDSENPKMTFPMASNGRQFFFRRIPEITHKDIAGVKAVPNRENPKVYDLVLQLNQRGSNRLANISNANQGAWFGALLNGRSSGAVVIDGPINDGVLVIWGSATDADLTTLRKAFPKTYQGPPAP